MTRNMLPDPAEGSRFALRVRRRYERELALLPTGLPELATLRQTFDALRQQGSDIGAALRITRHLAMERLVCLDTAQQASLSDVTRTMTTLAEFALDQAWCESERLLQEQHGAPMTASGQPAQACIVGMGKFGARELNVSSDIDLIYIYDQDGETTGDAQGRRRLSNQEYFGKMVRAVYALVGDTTEHGFVFRVDLALRPNGNSGPPAISLAGLEEYFQVQGREWERFAWLKSRVVAPQSAKASACAQNMRNAIIPFVFRRYLDYNVFDSLRVLHRQIRDHAAQRSAGHPERNNDVKLSRGGIREIEFTVQLLQVVRGGQFPELRTRPTLSALERLTGADLMPGNTAQALARAYEFLRRLEHRIQYLDDQQTHVLPTDDADLAWIASTLGFADTAAFLCELTAVRELVAQEFDALLGGPSKECQGCQPGSAAAAAVPIGNDFDALLAPLEGRLRERVATWREHPRMLALREGSRTKLARLLQRTGQWVTQGQVSEEGALRFADWMEPLMRRESYLALLLERPVVHERLLDMLAAARWPARYLLKHPGVIDELAGNAILEERFVPEEFERELEFRRQSLAGGGEDDDESLLNLLRRAHHAEVFRTLARDVEKRLTVEQVADDLSALADSVLRVTTRWCWNKLRQRHQDEARFGIIAYGKLGGKELGYGSDLDLVFVYDDPHENAPEIYAALVRKLINWLTVKTGEGDLYEIDTALRPNGGSGLLVTSFEAFANYQQQRGSNTAWTWEHQAMTRARCVLGDASLHARFEEVRQAVIATERDRAALREEIVTMRAKMRSGNNTPPDVFDVKHSPGGMVDVEFAVQYLVLGWGCQYPQLWANLGNIALLQRAEQCGLLPPPLGTQAADAYRSLRHLQHQARLNEEPTQWAADRLANERNAGLALWQHLFLSDA